MSELFLLGNNTYKWIQKENKFFIGYIFDEENSVFLTKEFAIEKIKFNLKKQFSGIYSYIEISNDKILIKSDLINFFPIFFYYSNNNWILSDSWIKLLKIKEFVPNKNVFPSFETAGFVPNYNTLDKDILRTKSGKITELHPNGKINNYDDYKWITDSFFTHTLSELSLITVNQLFEAGKRLVKFLNGRMAVLPLSGGFDSRLIASILKKLNYSNVVCFTYGKHTKETEISEKVASSLGYKWYFVDYTKINYKNYINDQRFINYADEYANGSSMPYLQEYFAVKYLKDKNLIDNDAVFLPGHSGDYLGGSYVLRTANTTKKGIHLAKHITKKYFFFRKLHKKEISIINQQVLEEINDYRNINYIPQKYNQFVEDWDLKEKLSKFIARSSYVFTFFGHEHYFIFWDKNLTDFFRHIPFDYRRNKILYNETLINFFFKELNIYFNNEEIKTSYAQVLFQKFKDKIRYFFPWNIVLKQMIKNDWINYSTLTQEMEQYINHKTDKKFKRFKSFNAIICKWYIIKLLNKN